MEQDRPRYLTSQGGIDVHREGGLAFDIFDIQLPEDVFYKMDHEDGLVDMFSFSIIGVEESTGGRVLLFDVQKRLGSLPDQVRNTWSAYVSQAYALLLQTVPENEWYTLATADTLDEARVAFGTWLSKIEPGKPIKAPRGKDEITIWNSGLPGIRTLQTFGPLTPYSYLTCPN